MDEGAARPAIRAGHTPPGPNGLLTFGRSLPRVRKRVAQDLHPGRPPGRAQALARLVRRLDDGLAAAPPPSPAGEAAPLTAAELDDYLSEAAGRRLAARDFTAWQGNVLALALTHEAGLGEGATGQRFDPRPVLEAVAARLRVPPSACRQACHPALLQLWAALARGDAATATARPAATPPAPRRGLLVAEQQLLRLLRGWGKRVLGDPWLPRRAAKRLARMPPDPG